MNSSNKLVVQLDDIAQGWNVIDIATTSLLVYRSHQGYQVFRNTCPHQLIPFDRFDIDASTKDYLQCTKHGAMFEESGECISGPCEGQALTALDHDLGAQQLTVYLPEA